MLFSSGLKETAEWLFGVKQALGPRSSALECGKGDAAEAKVSECLEWMRAKLCWCLREWWPEATDGVAEETEDSDKVGEGTEDAVERVDEPEAEELNEA